MFLTHKLYMLFGNFFFSFIVSTAIHVEYRSSSFFQTVVQKWSSCLTTGLSFPSFFCLFALQGSNKLCKGKYILQSLVLDFLLFFSRLTPQKAHLVSQCFIYILYLKKKKIPKSPSLWPTLTKLNFTSGYLTVPALGSYSIT